MIDNLSMSAPEVASLIGIGKNKVYELARTGELPSYKIGRKLRFSMRDVDSYIAHCRTAVKTTKDAANEALANSLDASSLDARLPDVLTDKGFDPFVFAGEGLAGDILASLLTDTGESINRRATTSYAALANIYCAHADLATVNLYDAFTNTYNLPYVKHLIPGMPVFVIRLAKQKVGFVYRLGQEKRLPNFSTWGSLLREGVRIANYKRGSGMRVLLDEKLISMEARPENIVGWDDEAECATEAIEWVAAGRADVTLGCEQDVKFRHGLAFHPLQTEVFDLVVRKTSKTRALIRKIKEIAASSRFADMLHSLGDMNVEGAGSILFEC